MLAIDLATEPGQRLSCQTVAGYFELVFRTTGTCMAVDISLNSVAICTGARVVAGAPLLPYAYQESGNFILTTMNDELPDWQAFGVTQFLYYLTQAELGAL